MSYGEWISLGLALLGLAITFVGTAIKFTWWLGDRLDKITMTTADALNQHEEKDQARQKELLQRITKVETTIEIQLGTLGNRRQSVY